MRTVTVCDKCFRASCWHGIHMCGDGRTAGTVQKTVKELDELKKEHPSYYSAKEVAKHTGGRI